MEQTLKKVISLGLLFCCSVALGATTNSVTPKFTIRSQGTAAYRRDVQSAGQINLYDMDKLNGTLALTLEYDRSFSPNKIARCLFGGSDDCNSCDDGATFNIQGSRVADRDANAWLADYLYLPPDFSSKIKVKPVIQNFSADLFFFFGLDEWAQGLYFWIQGPVTWTKWDLGFCESIVNTGTQGYDAGYFTPNALPNSDLLTSAKSYFAGKAPGNGSITQTDVITGRSGGAAVTGDVTTKFDPLTCGKICGTSSKTTVPEIRFALGWNFLLDEDYHLGLNIQASAPTGNTENTNYLFAAQNGNGKHWGLGGGLTAHFTLWRSDDEESNFGFYVDANLLHLFKHNECCCFDLCGYPLSRYMLAEKMGSTITNGLVGGATFDDGTAATSQFQAEFSPVADITTFNVDISVGVDADVVAWFNYTNRCWSWDIGYNFWGQTCPKIRLDNCSNFTANTWALKGDSMVYGFASASSGDIQTNQPVALSATMSKATINGGLNFGSTASINVGTAEQNLNIDNPQLAFANNGADVGIALYEQPNSGNQINTSIQPTFITQSNINFAKTQGLSNMVFTHIGYTWTDKEDWIPYVGIGGKAEFATHNDNCGDECCSTSCSNSCNNCGTTNMSSTSNSNNNNCNLQGNCMRCGLSQWGIWIKGGVSFN